MSEPPHPLAPLAHPLQLGPVSLARVRRADVVDYVFGCLGAGAGGRILTVNLDLLQQAWGSSEIAALFERAEVRVADGMPVLWLAARGGRPLPERVAGSDLVWDLAARAATEGRRLFLLGGEPGVAERAATRLEEHAPGLQIAGWASPTLDPEPTAAQLEPLRAELAASRPDLVYCAFGAPKQERLAEALREDVPGAWWLGCGISLSFIAGDVTRAPDWAQRSGLEWLHRMVQEPGRLAGRYLGRNLPFLARLAIRQALRGDVVGGS